jgi:hypothetical protein
MRPHVFVHRLAIVALVVTAVLSMVGTSRLNHGRPLTQALSMLFAATIWGFLTERIVKHPRTWGLPIGLFLQLLLAFQLWLWWEAIHNPKLAITPKLSDVLRLIADELPLATSAVACFLLPLVFMGQPKPLPGQ